MREVLKPLNSYEGIVYDMDYVNEIAYRSVEEFVNHIAEIEINLAIGDCKIEGKDYREDEFYLKYKRLKDTQKISESELNELLEMYNYDVIQ